MFSAPLGVLGNFNRVTADHMVWVIGEGSDPEPDLPHGSPSYKVVDHLLFYFVDVSFFSFYIWKLSFICMFHNVC